MVKQRIVEEASALFAQTGVRSTTMDDIARHLGISKRTIYENFRDKETLLIACLEVFKEKNREKMEKVFSEADNVVHAIMVWLQMGAEPAARRQINIMTDIRKYYPQVFREHLTCITADKYKNIEYVIQRGISEGVFRSELNPEIIAHIFCRQDNSATLNDNVLEKYSIAEIFENMALTFLRGICSPKGIEIIEKYKNKITYR
jgi:AcrR family transcriptional regulator